MSSDEVNSSVRCRLKHIKRRRVPLADLAAKLNQASRRPSFGLKPANEPRRSISGLHSRER